MAQHRGSLRQRLTWARKAKHASDLRQRELAIENRELRYTIKRTIQCLDRGNLWWSRELADILRDDLKRERR